MNPLYISGMAGMGDNLHQRAILREMTKDREVWLETPWPSIYHDMPQIHLLPRHSHLRTQEKNRVREAERFQATQPPANSAQLTIHYTPTLVNECGSVLGAMCRAANVPVGDFSMPVAPEWAATADALLREWKVSKPLMIYRPLVERTEWTGGTNRNPDIPSYAELVRSVRDRFFILSIADLVPGVEWMTSEPIGADVEMHKGEIPFDILAGLFSRASLVVAAPGFAIVLAQAVGAPAVCVNGGYEDARSFSAGARFSPTLAIQPIRPCPCWSHIHKCDKTLDMPQSLRLLQEFVDATANHQAIAA